MKVEKTPARFEVLSDNVGVPKGTYEGHIEVNVQILHGHEKRSQGNAFIYVSREAQFAGGRSQDSNMEFTAISVRPLIASGDVRQISLGAPHEPESET
jgi:hypothetical protein